MAEQCAQERDRAVATAQALSTHREALQCTLRDAQAQTKALQAQLAEAEAREQETRRLLQNAKDNTKLLHASSQQQRTLTGKAISTMTVKDLYRALNLKCDSDGKPIRKELSEA
eukprot:scaffold18014_cov48-Prasinocladus_malaysianus.AAC.1